MIAFIDDHRGVFGVGPICRVLGIAPSTYYAFKAVERDPDLASDRARQDQLDMAAIALRDDAEDAAFQIAALTRLAPRIALETARLGIQIHGGIGFSAEADAHHYLKQAHLLGLCLGRTDLLALPAPMAPTRKETT